MTRLPNLALAAAICIAAGPAHAQATSDAEGMTLGEMIEDGSAKVDEMSGAVEHVRRMREDAEDSGDASAYQRLNNFYTSMNSRLLYAEEALEALRNIVATSSSKARSRKQGADRALAEHHYSVIVAAYTRVMGDYREALSVMNAGVTDGDGTMVTGAGTEDLPGYDVTDRGRTTDPAVQRNERDNSEFQGRTGSTTEGGG